MEKYSYVRFTKLNGDEYWKVKIKHPWYKPWTCKWAYRGFSGYGGACIIQLIFDTQQEAHNWVKDDIANDLRIKGLKVVRMDKFEPLKGNSLMDELIEMIDEGF